MEHAHADARPWLATITLTGLILAACGGSSVPVPATPSFGRRIENHAPFDRTTACHAGVGAGMNAFIDMMRTTYGAYFEYHYPNVCRCVNKKIPIPCHGSSFSPHAEGRAIDLKWSALEPSQLRLANAFRSWLVDHSDQYGNRNFRTRRMQVQYVEYNRQEWQSTEHERGWQPGDDDHITNLHVEFTRFGANWSPVFGPTTWFYPPASYP